MYTWNNQVFDFVQLCKNNCATPILVRYNTRGHFLRVLGPEEEPVGFVQSFKWDRKFWLTCETYEFNLFSSASIKLIALISNNETYIAE